MNQWLVPIIVAVVGPAVAYLIAIRKASGRIATTEASELWEEAGKIRAEYRQEVDDLRKLVTQLRTRIGELEQANSKLVIENIRLVGRLAELERK